MGGIQRSVAKKMVYVVNRCLSVSIWRLGGMVYTSVSGRIRPPAGTPSLYTHYTRVGYFWAMLRCRLRGFVILAAPLSLPTYPLNALVSDRFLFYQANVMHSSLHLSTDVYALVYYASPP